jgi:membrane dipeptidase
MLPISSKSYMDLPTAGRDTYYESIDGQQHKLNLKRLAVGVSLALGTSGLLYKPAIQHYQRLAHDACSKTLSVDQRAQRILSTTPLIGKKSCP